MTDKEKAIQKARSYKTVYSEDYQFDEVMKHPLRFEEDYIKGLYLLLKEKHYRDGYSDGLAEGRKEIEQLKKDCSIWESRAKGLLHKNEMVDVYTLQKENADLNRDKTELVNSVTELKTKVTELEAQLKNNPYVELLQNEKTELAEDFAKQIEKNEMGR